MGVSAHGPVPDLWSGHTCGEECLVDRPVAIAILGILVRGSAEDRVDRPAPGGCGCGTVPDLPAGVGQNSSQRDQLGIADDVGGDVDRPWWDAIIVVEYPSPNAFLETVRNPEYATINEHRVAALDRAELIATTVWSDNQ